MSKLICCMLCILLIASNSICGDNWVKQHKTELQMGIGILGVMAPLVFKLYINGNNKTPEDPNLSFAIKLASFDQNANYNIKSQIDLRDSIDDGLKYYEKKEREALTDEDKEKWKKAVAAVCQSLINSETRLNQTIKNYSLLDLLFERDIAKKRLENEIKELQNAIAQEMDEVKKKEKQIQLQEKQEALRKYV